MQQPCTGGCGGKRAVGGAIRLLAPSPTVGEGYRGGSEKTLILLSKVIILIHGRRTQQNDENASRSCTCAERANAVGGAERGGVWNASVRRTGPSERDTGIFHVEYQLLPNFTTRERPSERPQTQVSFRVMEGAAVVTCGWDPELELRRSGSAVFVTREESDDFQFLASFRATGKKLTERPKPESARHLRIAAEVESGASQVAGRTAAILYQSDMLVGMVSAPSSGRRSPPRPRECVPVVLVA
jgi:hypothetical protein